MNKKGVKMIVVYTITIILAFAVVALVTKEIIYKRMAGKEGLFSDMLGYIIPEKKSFDEVKSTVEEYEKQGKWEDIIDELIYYREESPGEGDDKYIEEKAYTAYDNLYRIKYIEKMKNPKEGDLNQFAFCSNAIMYYEKKDIVFDDFSKIDDDKIETTIRDIANFCYKLKEG